MQTTFTPEQLAALGRTLQVAVREVVPHAWTEETGDAWRTVLDHVVDVMARGCADTTDDPARRRTWEATVVSRERVAEDLAVVRLQVHRGPEDGPGDPVPALAAGQHLQVETARRPGMWRRFSPATAPGPDGQVELHVRAVPGGWVSGAVVAHAAPGERWRVAAPAGSLRVDRASGRDVLMLAGGTGLAPLRSLVLDLARAGGAPRVHLFVGARHPGDLYDLELLGRVATANPWLTVVPVVESTSAPWGRFPVRERPPGVAVTLVGRLVDVVTGFGAWDDRQALVCGSRAMVRASVAGLVAAGMPAHQVWRDPLGGGPAADERGRHRRPGSAAG